MNSEAEEERLIREASETIIRLMDESELTRSELARRMGVHKSRVTTILNGPDDNMRLGMLAKIGAVMGVRFRVGIERIR